MNSTTLRRNAVSAASIFVLFHALEGCSDDTAGTGGKGPTVTSSNSSTTSASTTSAGTTSASTTSSGAGGAGGTSGVGGAGGSSEAGGGGTGGSPVFDFAWTFDTGVDGWASAYSDPASLNTDTLVSFDATTGSPDVGSVKYEIPFTNGSQKYETAVYPSPPLDLTGKTLSANVRLDSGLGGDPTQTGYVKVYVKSGDAYAYADAGGNLLPAGGGWITVKLNADAPEGFITPGYNPADIREVGLEFGTGTGTNFVTATIHLDTVGYY